MLAGVGAAGLVGIENGESAGQDGVRSGRGFGQVMIGDDEIEAEGFGGLCGGEGADASIDADDEADALRGCGFKNLIAHAVAFAKTVRDVETDFAAEHFNGCFEQDGGGGAVYVVVAVDEDRLAALDGLL